MVPLLRIQMNRFKWILKGEIPSLLWNLLLAMITYMVCRFIYWAENYSSFANIPFDQWKQILTGGLKFDLSAVLYTNIILIVLFAIPCHLKEKMSPKIGKFIFLLFNGLGIVMNLMDAVYFNFTGRRTTASVFQEFSGEDNLVSIFLTEIFHHWYFVLAAVVMIYALVKLYRSP